MRLASLAACAALFLLAPGALAQGTTASLTGTVTDATGGPIPSANVVAVHTPSGTTYGAATRLDGRYDLRGLRVGGPYTVTATFIGFQVVERTGISLALGQTETVDFTLSEGDETLGEVTVTAEASGAVISKGRTGQETNVSEADIEALPTISRSLSDFARLNPLSAGGGSSSVAGRNNRYNNVQIDGATLNDVFGLAGSGTPGGQAGTQPISLDAVEEFNVAVAPYDVRQSGFTGGLINAVTKSGTNQFAGSLRLQGRNQDLVGDLESESFDNFSEGLGVFTLGGPILRDKLFFFVSGEVTSNEFPDNTGLAGTNAVNTSLITADQAGSVLSAANDVYGYNAGTTDLITDARTSQKLLAKLDWNVNSSNTFSIRHNFVDADDDQGVSRSRFAYDLSARRYVFRSLQNSTVAQLNTQIGDRASNEARLVYTAIRDERDVADAPFPETSVFFGDTSVRLGIDRFSQANALDQDLVEFTNDFTLFRGAHTITLGTNNQFYRFDNLFIQDYYGAYQFNPDDFGNDVTIEGLTGSPTGADLFRLGLPTRYQFSYASGYDLDEAGRLRYGADGNPVRTAQPDLQPRAEFTALQLGLYAQDEWDVTDALRLTLGVRMDVPIVPEEPVENPLVSGGTGVNPDGSTFEIAPAFVDADGQPYSTTNTASGNPLFSPRFGFNYTTAGLGGQPLQLRGGTGLFTGRTPFVWISNQFSNTGVDLARLDARLNGGAFDTDGDGVISQSEQGFFPGTALPGDQPLPGDNAALVPIQTTEINLIDPDFKFPQVFRTNLGLDQDLGSGFVVTAEGLYSTSVNDISYRNLNIAQTATSAYGRPLYAGRVDPNFTNALLLENDSQGYEYSLVGQIRRTAVEGVGGSLSYTYNRAENVNNGTSSRAISNWQFNENLDINNPRIGTADFEVRHRVLGTLSYRQSYLDRFSSELGVIFDSQAGEPYSWIYDGDANFDGQRFNDLVYVPQNETDVFLTTDNWDLVDAFIASEDGLEPYRGEVAPRNTSKAPWQTRLDLEFTQGVETLRGQRIDFEVTLINVLNALNADWGRIRGTAFNNLNAFIFDRYVAEGDVGSELAGRVVSADDLGKPVVRFNERTVTDALTGDRFSVSNLASRWQLRFGVKYSF